MGANADFNQLFQDFQKDDFFKDALYSLSWVESEGGGFDFNTGTQLPPTLTTYTCNAFISSPTRSDAPAVVELRNYQSGDLVALVRQDELVKAPPIGTQVSFAGSKYICKEIKPDAVGVSWKLLLRG